MENLTHSVSGIQFSELVYTTLSNHLFSTWEKTNGWKAKQRSTKDKDDDMFNLLDPDGLIQQWALQEIRSIEENPKEVPLAFF